MNAQVTQANPGMTNSKRVRWAYRILRFFIGIVILSPLIAGKEPLVLVQNGHLGFPAFSTGPYYKIYFPDGKEEINLRTNINWRKIPAGFRIFRIIPYNADESDMLNGNAVSPFEAQYELDEKGNTVNLPLRFRHWLGTTKRGTDVLSGIISGAKISLFIGFGSMLIAASIGFLLGAISGYFGDYSLKMPRGLWLGVLIMLVPAWFYSWGTPIIISISTPDQSMPVAFLKIFIRLMLFVLILLFPFLCLRVIRKIPFLNREDFIPVDSLLSRVTELFLSLPRLVLIITLAAMTKPSVLNILLIIGFSSWTDIARLVRVEMMRLSHSGFSEATSALGFPVSRIIWRHLIPNAIGPVSVLILFGIGGAVLSEAALSVLGIGLPAGVVSWGTLMFEGRSNFSAWWLVLIPGISISLLILAINTVADAWRERWRINSHA